MVKRAAPSSDESDFEIGQGSQAKRSRHTNGRASGAATRSNPAPAADDASDDLDDDDDDDDDAELAEMLRQQQYDQSKQGGTVAQAGVVSRVEVFNFMCHQHVSINFGPQLNFIVGHNGSGKSAFLTAITIALGGKANSTGRGLALKELVRNVEGVDKAVIKLRLLNKGPDAYRPEAFGGIIAITRTIGKTGGNSYTLADGNGRKVASTRTELQAICDHYNIQVDNPINILSQDNARQFLATSSPRDKYLFFLKGTLLSQLLDDYDKLQKNALELDHTIQSQDEAVKQLKADGREAAAKWDAVKSVLDSQEQLEKKKKQLAWAYVVEAETAFEMYTTQEMEETAKLERLKEQQRKARKRYDDAIECKTACQAELDASAARDTRAIEEVNEITSTIRNNTNDMKKLRSDMATINQEIRSARDVINQFDLDIEAAEQRNSEENAERLAQLQEEHTQFEEEVKQASEQVDEVKHRRNQAGDKLRNCEEQCRSKRQEISNTRDQVTRLQQELDQVSGDPTNVWGRFPRGTEAVCQAIAREQWHGEQPMGPIARYIKLTDDKWSALVETILGFQINGFVVTDRRDRDKLSGILHRHQLSSLRVFFMERDDTFDCRRGEPDPHFTTVLRVLSFEDDLARQVVVNALHVESLILVNDRHEGERIMPSRPRNVLRCYSLDFHNVSVGRGGGFITNDFKKYWGVPRLSKDSTVYKRGLQDQLKTAETSLRQLNEDFATLQRDFNAASSKRQRLDAELKRLDLKARTAQGNVSKTREQIAMLQPSDIAGPYQAKYEREEAIKEMAEQYAGLQSRLDALSAENAPLVQQREELKAIAAQTETIRQVKEDEMSNHIRNELQASSDLEHFKKQRDEAQAKKDRLTAQIDEFGRQIEKYVEKAEEIADRETVEQWGPIPSDPKKLQNEIQSRQRTIDKQDRQRGMSIDEIKAEMKRTSDAYNKACNDVNQMIKLLNALKASLELRITRWEQFKRYIVIRAKIQFLMFTSKRGYEGRLKFNHAKQRLEIQVKTDESAKAARKDARSLSGGEKSFSTVAFLLALWEAVNCPIRGLDEFDVFQDSVNRDTSIKMLVEAARMTNEKQHILITPNALKGYGADVRVHRLDDPERNQGTIQFGS